MKHPKAIDPKDRKTPFDPKAIRRRELNAISRAKREGADGYAARILRDLEIKEEYAEFNEEL